MWTRMISAKSIVGLKCPAVNRLTGWCTLFNTAILNEFANLGIYDYTSYLFLDFDKGTPTVYLKYYDENENLEYDLNGYTTTEIIFTIFELTIFSGRSKRPRS